MNTTAQLFISESGGQAILNNDLLSNSSIEFDYAITGAPATMTIAVEGEINGSVAVLDTYGGTANAVRTISLNSVTYNGFRVIASWTGGFNVGVSITAKSSGPGQTAF